METLKILSITVCLFLNLAGQGAAAVTVGEPAPDFQLTDTNNNPVSLSSYKGKFVVLEWFNADCPFSRKHYEAGNIQQLQKAYADKGVVWLTIASSAPGKQGNYGPQETNDIIAKREAAPTAVLLDASGEVGHLYDAKTTPHMFVVDPEGKVIYQGAIDTISSADATEVPQADNYVKAALDAAMSGQPVAVSSTKSYGCSVKY